MVAAAQRRADERQRPRRGGRDDGRVDLERRFVEHVRDAKLVRPGERVVVACSGGGDSVALAHLLVRNAAELGLAGVLLAHLDHMLRPESARDAEFVADLARQLEVAATIEQRTVVPQRGQGPEAAARRVRYEFLEEVATKVGASVIAAGHQLDDQAETVLFRTLRGTGPTGLRSIPPSRPIRRGSSVRLVRPLLPFRREELRAWLGGRGHAWREDATNLGGNVRALLRRDALPVLEKCLGRDPAPALARLAELLETPAQARLDGVGEAFLEWHDGEVRAAAGFERLPQPIRVRTAAQALARLRGETGLPPLAESRRVAAALAGRPKGGVRGVELLPHVCRLPGANGLAAPPEPTPLAIPGKAAFGDLVLSARVRPAENAVFLERLRAEAGTMELLDAAKVRGGLLVRARRTGDRFRPLGAVADVRLGHYLQRAGVVGAARDRVPLVCDDVGILWVVGHGIAHRARVGNRTDRLVVLTASNCRRPHASMPPALGTRGSER